MLTWALTQLPVVLTVIGALFPTVALDRPQAAEARLQATGAGEGEGLGEGLGATEGALLGEGTG